MKRFFPFLILVIVSCVFFYQFIFFAKIPFPGDLLIAEYVPWKYESFLGFNPGSYPNKAQYFDVIQQLYPWRQLAVEQIKLGKIPLWNPYNFSGAPLLANIQSSVFNPVNVFFFVFPFAFSWAVTVFLQCLLASVFMYLFAKKLGLSMASSFLSSIAYSYSLFMTVFLEYNTLGYILVLLPAAALLSELYVERRTFFRTTSFTVAIASLFLVGHLQLAIVAYIFLFFYTMWQGKRTSSYKWHSIFLTIPFLLAPLIASMQLFPTIELLSYSARVPQEYAFLVEKLLIQPWQYIMIAIPDIFGNPVTRNFIPDQTYPTKALSIGTVALLFAFIGLWQWKEQKKIRFFVVAGVTMLLLVTKNPISLLLYNAQIPLFSTSSPSNMIFLSSFCLSILAGFGMQAWLEKKQRIQGLLVFLGFLTICFLLALQEKSYFQEKNILFSSLFLLAAGACYVLGSYKEKTKRVLGIVLIFFLAAELFFFFQKFNPFVDKSLVYPDTQIMQKMRSLGTHGDRVWSFGNATIEPNIQTQLKIFSPDGYDPLYPAIYGQLIAASQHGKIPLTFDRSSRSNAQIASQSDGNESVAKNAFRMKVLDILSVRYVLDRAENASSEKTFPEERFSQIYRNGDWAIYENKSALPRVWLANQYALTKTTKEFQDIFFSRSFQQDKTVTLPEELDTKLDMKNGKVMPFLQFSDRMLYKTESDGASILVLSQAYYPGWQVFVDGKEEKLLRVNHALSGVFVPKGEHDVSFYYWPSSFVFGLYITIMSSVGLFVFAFLTRKKHS